MNVIRETIQEVKASFILTLKDCLTYPSFIFEISLSPFIYTLIAAYLFRDASMEQSLFYILLGAGCMGVWDSTLFGGSLALQNERNWGTLEYLLSTSSNLLTIIFGKCLVYALIGLIVLAEVFFILVLGYSFNSISIDYLKLAISFFILIIGFSIIGFVLSFGFLFTRSFIQIANVLADGVKTFSGVLFPVAILPLYLKILSFLLPTTWGLEIVKSILIDHDSMCASNLIPILLFIVLSFLYIIMAIFLSKFIEFKIRQKGEFSKL